MKFSLAALVVAILLAQECAARENSGPFGDGSTEARLKRVIHETVKPKPLDRNPLPADVAVLLQWSKPVGGLAARIEWAWGYEFFVRLKNVSAKPLTVPTGNPADEKAVALFEIDVQQGASPWRAITGTSRYNRYYSPKLKLRDRPWVTLQPGEDCIAPVSGFPQEGTGEPKFVKACLRQADAGDPLRWSGVLETLPRPIEMRLEQSRALTNALPLPRYYPQFSYQEGGVVPAEAPNACSVRLLEHSNLSLILGLDIYQPRDVCREFEQRLRTENYLPMKLLLARIAAAAGSEEAALFLLETANRTDWRTVENLRESLADIYRSYQAFSPERPKGAPPAWLHELSLAIVTDNRQVTDVENSGWGRNASFTIASHSEDLLSHLVHFKCRKVVQLLKGRVRNDRANWRTWSQLAELGDSRAISELTRLLELAATKNRLREEQGPNEVVTGAGYALAELKARDAVPVLLTFLEYPEIIRDLGEIGDGRASPALDELISAKGRILHNGKRVRPKLEPERLFAARLARARLEPQKELQLLDEMLAHSDRHHRYDVVMRLAQLSDPRVVAILVRVIKTDSDHYVLGMAIRDLGERKCKAAVEGLIACFDVEFKAEDMGKGEHVTPATYRNQIAHSLQEITGESFGADKQQWLTWWQEQGRRTSNLK